jgi:hypothetical protein
MGVNTHSYLLPEGRQWTPDRSDDRYTSGSVHGGMNRHFWTLRASSAMKLG